MKYRIKCLRVILILTVCLFCCESQAENFFVVPFDVDPPIQIDADLDDWMNIPNPIYMQSREHVTLQKKSWEGPKDLSAVIRLAWRQGLYLAVEVTDDIVQQPFSGKDIWKGNYIDLWLDMKPTFEVDRTLPGNGQVHIGISPGNFDGTAGVDGFIQGNDSRLADQIRDWLLDGWGTALWL